MIGRRIVTCIIPVIFIFIISAVYTYAADDTLKDKINNEMKKRQENETKKSDIKTEDEFGSALKKEYENQKDRVYSKYTMIDTAKAVSLKYLPFLIAILFIMFILGAARESLKFLTKAAIIIAFFSAIGYILIFFVEPIVSKIIETVKNIRI